MKNWQRLLLSAASLFVSKCVSLSEYNRAVTHARGGSEGSQGCREDADDDLNDGLPSFFLHSALFLMVNVTDSIILARIPRIFTALFIQLSGARRPRVWRQSTVVSDFTLGPDPRVHPSIKD